MPSEAVIERMIVQLVGDGRQYRQMLVEARMMTSTYTTQIGSLWRNAAGQMITSQKKMQAEMLVAQSVAIKSAMAMRVFGTEVARAGKSLSMYLTAPLAAMGAAAIKFGSDFESGFAGVRKTVDATEPEFAKLNTQFRELAATIPVSAEQLLRIGEIAGQLGIKTGDIIGFTRTIAEMSVTTNLTIEEGADSMARLAIVTQMSQDKFHNLGSAIVALGNKLPATEQEITEMSMRIAAAGTTVGLAVPEILALAGALTSIGIKSEMGGSAISRMMLQVSKDIATGSETIDKFAQISGMSTEKFKESWRADVAQTLLTFLTGLESLDAETAAVALDELELDGIRLHQTMLGSAKAVGMFRTAIDLANKSFAENTELTEEAEKRFATFASGVGILYNQFKLLLTEVFEVARPYLVSMIDAVESMTKAMRGWSAETKGTLIVVGAIVAALGPLLLISGSLIAAIGQLRLAFLFIKPAMFAVFGVPGLGQILAVVALLVMAFSDWDETLRYLKIAFEPFKNLFSALVDLFDALMAATGPLIRALGESLVGVLQGTVSILSVIINMLTKFISMVTEGLNETVALVEYVTNHLPGMQAKGDVKKIGMLSEMNGSGGTAMSQAKKPSTPAHTPVTSTFDPQSDQEIEWGKQFKNAFERVDDMKAKFDDELTQMQMSERDYLFHKLEREQEKGVFDDDLNEVMDAYDKLQEAKKKAAAIEAEAEVDKQVNSEIKALRDQRKELELGERAFIAWDLARKGASKTQVKAALGIYDEIQALEALKDKEEEDKKAAEEAKEAHDKFRDSIQRTIEGTSAGMASIIAREEAKGRRPEDPKNLKEEEEKKKAEKEKQAQLAEKAFDQGVKIYDVLLKIKENTTNATGSGPIVTAANIGE